MEVAEPEEVVEEPEEELVAEPEVVEEADEPSGRPRVHLGGMDAYDGVSR